MASASSAVASRYSMSHKTLLPAPTTVTEPVESVDSTRSISSRDQHLFTRHDMNLPKNLHHIRIGLTILKEPRSGAHHLHVILFKLEVKL